MLAGKHETIKGTAATHVAPAGLPWWGLLNDKTGGFVFAASQGVPHPKLFACVDISSGQRKARPPTGANASTARAARAPIGPDPVALDRIFGQVTAKSGGLYVVKPNSGYSSGASSSSGTATSTFSPKKARTL